MCCLRNLITTSEICLIFGDFNVPSIDWNDLTSQAQSKAHVLLSFCCDGGLVQANNFPTRGTNILDIVFTNDPAIVSRLEVGPPFGSSDHNSLLMCIVLPICNSSISVNYQVQIFDWSNANWLQYAQYCFDVSLNTVFF
jgi:hypothetical protein